MALSNAAGAAPIFLGPPVLYSASDSSPGALQSGVSPAVGQIVATSQQPLVHRIYQLDPTATWVGTLGADDTKTETIIAGMYVGSTLTAVTADTFILLNHNLNNFKLEYCTDYQAGTGGGQGSSISNTWTTIFNITGQAAVDYANFQGSALTFNGLRLTMTTTSPANKNKQLANLIVALSLFQLSQPQTKLTHKWRQRRIEVPMADGTKDYTYLQWSDNASILVDPEPQFDLLSSADKSNMDTLMTRTQPFLYYPEPGDNPRAIYLCTPKISGYVPEYTSEYKGAGYKFAFPMEHVGWW